MPTPGAGPSLARNILHNLAGQLLTLLLTLVAVKFILVRLGPGVFGVIFFVLTISPLLVAALEMGLSSTIVRQVAAHSGRDDGYITGLVRTSATIYWALYLLAVLSLLPLSSFLSTRWLHLEGLSAGDAALVLVVLSAGALTALPRALYSSVLRGLRDTATVNLVDTGTVAVQQTVAAILLALGAGTLPVVTWLAAAYALATIVYAVAVGRRVGWVALAPSWTIAVVRDNLRFSRHVFAVSILQTVNQQLDRLVVSSLVVVSLFGAYSFMASLALRGSVLSLAIYLAGLPALAVLIAGSDHAAALARFRKLNDLQCYLAALTMTVVPFAVLPLGGYLFGHDVADRVWLPVSLVALGVFMQMAMSTPVAVALAAGRPGIVARAFAGGAAVAAPITYVSVRLFGISGGGIGIVVFNAIAGALMIPAVTRRLLGIPASDWFRQVGTVALLWAISFGATLTGLALSHHLQALPLAGGYLAAALAFTLLFYRWGMGAELRGVTVRSAVESRAALLPRGWSCLRRSPAASVSHSRSSAAANAARE